MATSGKAKSRAKVKASYLVRVHVHDAPADTAAAATQLALLRDHAAGTAPTAKRVASMVALMVQAATGLDATATAELTDE